jgi:alkylation response protein AidB-like acyl-CoA dehydrogenase
VALTPEELEGFLAAVDGEISRVWPSATAAGEDAASSMKILWDVAAAQGWADLATHGAVDALLAAAGRLGRFACPLPLVDVYVALQLLSGLPELAEAIRSGAVRPVVAEADADPQIIRCAEAASAATHVLLLIGSGVELRPIAGVVPTPGLAMPVWGDVTLSAERTADAEPGTDAVEYARTIVRLGLVARATGAAERTLELSIAFANERVAFGKPIGAFQAVSHRAADGATDVAASKRLVREAAVALQARRTDAILAAELAVAYAGAAAIRTQFGAQHTLAAQGCFEEHEAPWLFRRVNADVARLDCFPLQAGTPADVLIETAGAMPALELGDDAEEFREEVRVYLRQLGRDVSVHHLDGGDDSLTEQIRDRGWITMAWPTDAGGAAASVERQAVLGEEFAYARFPSAGRSGANMLGTAILRHGTQEQKQRLLPLLASGEFRYFLGYSEPEVGSDLAAMRTRAVRDGDEWVVNGRKMWGTGAHTADWVWLAARTDPDSEPAHAGITVFLTRVDRPGYEAHPHRALSGEISCSTFFDDFRVPDADRVGEVNGGWKVIVTALAQERVLMASATGGILRLFDDLLTEVRKDPIRTVGPRGSAKRALISELAARLQAARALTAASIRATSTGAGSRLEAPMAKIIASQLHEDFCEAALRILGPTAALGEDTEGVPGRGAFEYNLRYSIMMVVGGGTIDIQRNLVARSLGLAR